jgi:hypothetical protein
VIEQARERERSVRKKRKTGCRSSVCVPRRGGNGQGIERQVAVDVPKYRYVSKDEFDEPWHLASWVPNDPEGPTVLMNREAPLLLEAIKHHQQQYPEVFAIDVEKIVKDRSPCARSPIRGSSRPMSLKTGSISLNAMRLP